MNFDLAGLSKHEMRKSHIGNLKAKLLKESQFLLFSLFYRLNALQTTCFVTKQLMDELLDWLRGGRDERE